jgi:hypothetical protein
MRCTQISLFVRVLGQEIGFMKGFRAALNYALIHLDLLVEWTSARAC